MSVSAEGEHKILSDGDCGLYVLVPEASHYKSTTVF